MSAADAAPKRNGNISHEAAPSEGQEHDAAAPLDIALRFASKGWPIFPCNPKNKKPLTRRDNDPAGKPINGTGGFKRATTDPEVIAVWWSKHPDAMVGIPTGEIIRAFVLDIDIFDKGAGNIFTTVEAQIAAVEAELGIKLLAARAIPEAARDEVLDRASAGEKMSHQDVKDAVAKHKPTRRKPGKRLATVPSPRPEEPPRTIGGPIIQQCIGRITAVVAETMGELEPDDYPTLFWALDECVRQLKKLPMSPSPPPSKTDTMQISEAAE